MKLSWGATLSSLFCAATSASNVAHVFVSDPLPREPVQPETVSPETARLILAQRLGLSRFHSIPDVKPDVIQQINAFGGRSQRFFGAQNAEDWIDAQLLVWVEDVEDVRDIIKDTSKYSSQFFISTPPTSADNDRLIQDMILQAESLPKKADPQQLNYRFGIDTEAALASSGKAHTYNDYLTILRMDKNNRDSFAELSRTLHQILEGSVDAKIKGWGVTVVVMPTTTGTQKRSASPYGTYDIPSAMEDRREKSEMPLSPQAPQPSNVPQNSNVSDPEEFPTTQQAAGNNKAPLGILPVCFKALDECVTKTNNCTGHGECKLLRKGEEGSDARTRDCYGCECHSTFVHVGPDKGMEIKKKTTYWGGPACQKKDITQPFWLIVGTTVILSGLVASGIGLLYSMGGEELPSVIGAGVSGPVRK